MDSDLPTKNSPPPSQESEEHQHTAESSSQEQRYFFIKKDSKFTIADLVNIEPGTLLLTEDDGIGKQHACDDLADPYMVHNGSVGFQFFPVDFIRSQHFYSMSRKVRDPHQLLTWTASYDVTIRTNWNTYTQVQLEFQLKRRNKDEAIGLFLGDFIIGTRGAADIVVMMKILMGEEDVGWICFLKNRPDAVLLELQ